MRIKLLVFTIVLIVSASYAQDPVNWTRNIIPSTIDGAKKNFVINLDSDASKNMDIIVTANPEAGSSENGSLVNVVWFKNTGDEVFQQLNIDFYHVQARALAAGDLTGNGYPDVVVGSRSVDSSLVWYENDGTPDVGAWTKHHLGGPAPFNYVAHILDMDNDGDLDILDGMGDDVVSGTSVTDVLRWFENDGSGNFTERVIANYPTPSGIAYGDYDGDGDVDVFGMAWTNPSSTIVTADEDVRWWSNDPGETWTQQQLVQQTYGGNDAVSADVDGNGTLDVVGAGYKINTVDWWSNDGTGTFGSVNVVDNNFTHTRNVAAADIDGDGDMDLTATADVDNQINWYENDGNENFTEHQVNDNFTFAYFVTPFDLDGDGDIDLVGTAQDQDSVVWWESDLADEQSLASGDPPATGFVNNKVVIDYQSGFSGGNTSVFYNQGENSDRNLLGGGVDHIALSGYYTIKTTASAYTADIKFSYAGISEWSAINNEADLRMVAWDEDAGANGQWEIIGSTLQTIDEVNDTITVTGLTSELSKYSLFTLASVSQDNALPVELVAFTGRAGQKGITLTWETASEINNLGFELWRRSLADSTFRPVASYRDMESLKGLGTRSYGQEYTFTDANVQNGERYTYRLYDVDYNGKRYKHREIKVDNVDKSLVRVINGPEDFALQQNYPNPFNGRTVIEFKVPEALAGETVSLLVFDETGRKVRELYNRSLVPGSYMISWDGSSENGSPVASGMYIYQLKIGSYSVAKRMTLIK